LPILPTWDAERERGVADVIIMDNVGAFVIGIPTPKLREQLNSVVFKLDGLKCTSLIICDEKQ